MRLALGTVQFGLPYGVANATGQVPQAEVRAILQLARQQGVDVLDTAMDYGHSESVLGKAQVNDFKVITKLPGMPDGVSDPGSWVEQHVRASLARLGLLRLHGLLLHRPRQLLGPQGPALVKSLHRLKAQGLVERVGFSIYDPLELDSLLPVMRPDLVQAPLNLMDRRLVNTGWLARLHELGVAVHARSVFLQGLLLMPARSRPAQFSPWNHLWQRWDDWVHMHGASSARAACLSFVLSHTAIERAVVGVDHLAQWQQLLDSCRCSPSEWPPLSCEDLGLIDPSQWGRA